MDQESESPDPLRPTYKGYTNQACFVAHSHDTDWREDLIEACEDVLPKFDLQPWYADQHFDPTRPLRAKVVEAIANARYGIYDISNWQNGNGQWQRPRNVYIELGMALALNRPALILRHTSNQDSPLPVCLSGLKILEFSGETTLKRALEKHLPLWTNVPPDRDWFNRFCIFGDRVCSFREEHPRARQLGEKLMHCHVSDGYESGKLAALASEREETRAAIEDIFERYADIKLHHLGDLQLMEGYQFLLCSHCQAARSSQFAVYRIVPTTPPEVFIAIGMSIAIETLFEYNIPKVLLVRREQDLPSLLRGYEVVEVANSTELKRKLIVFVPSVMRKVRETTWRPRPLPFFELLPLPTIEKHIASVKQQAEPRVLLPARPSLFVGRERDVQELLNLLARKGSRIAISGRDGVGKTTLAAEVGWAVSEASMFDAVVWRNVSDLSLRADLKKWLSSLGDDATDAPLMELIKRWRELVSRKQILIVVDGVGASNRKELELITPPGCTVLLTTQTRKVPSTSEYHSVTVLPLSLADCVELLRKSGAVIGDSAILSDEATVELAVQSHGNLNALLSLAKQMLEVRTNSVPTPSSAPHQIEFAPDDLDDFINKLAFEVKLIMRREMFTPPGGPTYIPNEYIIYLSVEDDRRWEGVKRRSLEQGLFQILANDARELGGTTSLATKSFAVELRVDGTLSMGEFRVRANWDTSSPPDQQGSFSVGQTVVYPQYGVGVIEAVETRQMDSSDVLVYHLRLNRDNSVVLVPVSKAEEMGLRTPITIDQSQKLWKALEAEVVSSTSEDRYRVNAERIESGEILEVAEVLKELAHASLLRALSFREQRMLERAKYVLVSEIAVVLGQPEKSVETLVDDALAKALRKADRRPE